MSKPSPDYDTTVWKRIDANGYQITRMKAGKAVQTATNVVWKDGKTTTLATKGTNAKGETINNVVVVEKQ